MTPIQQDQQITNIPLKKIAPSGTNPRTIFDEAQTKELADSIKQHGIIEPLLVRQGEKKDTYILIAGERRYHAATLAKQLFAPCIIRAVNEAEAYELQVIENLQRADIHPLDESAAFAKLLDANGRDLASLCLKLGKEETYVRRCLQYNNLIEPFRKLWAKADGFERAHANLLGRLTEAEQKQMVDEFRDHTPSPPQLRMEIERTFFLQLAKVPFDVDDAALVTEAGSCTACPKRSGNAPALFPDVKEKDTCTDPACYQKKIDVHIEKLSAAQQEKHGKPLLRLSLKSWGDTAPGALAPADFRRVKAGDCKSVQKGIVVEAGHSYGDDKLLYKLLAVCADKKCSEHFGPNAAPAENDYTAKAKAEKKANAAKFRDVVAHRRAVADKLLEAACKPIDDDVQRHIARALYQRVSGPYRKKLAQDWFSIEAKKTKTHYGTYTDFDAGINTYIKDAGKGELGQFIVGCLVAFDALRGAGSYENSGKEVNDCTLFDLAKHYGLDIERLKPEPKAKPEKAPVKRAQVKKSKK